MQLIDITIEKTDTLLRICFVVGHETCKENATLDHSINANISPNTQNIERTEFYPNNN